MILRRGLLIAAAATVLAVAGVPARAAPLTLAACAERRVFLFSAYELRLYLPRPSVEETYVFAPSTPKAIRLRVTFGGDVPGGMPRRWTVRLSETLPPDLVARLGALYDRLGGGDILLIEYRPDSGSFLTLNGRPVLSAPGHALVAAFLGIWMGPRALHAEVRAQLLSGRCE